jgi:hypothetical protein
MGMPTAIRRGTVVIVDGVAPIVLDSNAIELFRVLVSNVKAGHMSRPLAVWTIRQMYPQLQLKGALDVFHYFNDGEPA